VIELRRLLNWKIGRLGAAENLINMICGAAILVHDVWSI